MTARWRIESVPLREPLRWRWRVIDFQPPPPALIKGRYFDTFAEALAAFTRGNR